MLLIHEQDCFMVISDLQSCYINVMKYLVLSGNYFTGLAKHRNSHLVSVKLLSIKFLEMSYITTFNIPILKKCTKIDECVDLPIPKTER